MEVTVLVELQESSSEYVLCLELAINGVRSSASYRLGSDATPIFVALKSFPGLLEKRAVDEAQARSENRRAYIVSDTRCRVGESR